LSSDQPKGARLADGRHQAGCFLKLGKLLLLASVENSEGLLVILFVDGQDLLMELVDFQVQRSNFLSRGTSLEFLSEGLPFGQDLFADSADCFRFLATQVQKLLDLLIS